MSFKTGQKNKIFKAIYGDLRDSKDEEFQDNFEGMIGIDYEGSVSDLESVEDYADNIFFLMDQ